MVVLITFVAMQSSYLNWNFNDPELAVAGTILHGIEFIFVRLAPLTLIAGVVGILLTHKKR